MFASKVLMLGQAVQPAEKIHHHFVIPANPEASAGIHCTPGCVRKDFRMDSTSRKPAVWPGFAVPRKGLQLM
jgi:hypothetical protein